MLGDASPSGTGLGYNKQSCDPFDLPASCPRDIRREANLPIQGRQQSTDIRNNGLHLHHEEAPRGWVERENVDGAALTKVVERDLRRNLPAFGLKTLDHRFHQRRVPPISQSVEALALIEDPH